jgi:hypothetical protein
MASTANRRVSGHIDQHSCGLGGKRYFKCCPELIISPVSVTVLAGAIKNLILAEAMKWQSCCCPTTFVGVMYMTLVYILLALKREGICQFVAFFQVTIF